MRCLSHAAVTHTSSVHNAVVLENGSTQNHWNWNILLDRNAGVHDSGLIQKSFVLEYCSTWDLIDQIILFPI